MKPNPPPHPDSSIKGILVCAGIFFFIFLLAVITMTAPAQYGLGELLQLVKDRFFIIHYSNFNQYVSGTIDNINIVTAFQKFTLAALLITVGIFVFFLNFLFPKIKLSFFKTVTICWVSAFLLFTVLTQLKRFDAFGSEYSQLKGKKLEERIAGILGQPYIFAYTCNQILKKPVNVTMLMDVSLSKDPYMTNQRILSYYSYPNLSIRVPREGDVDGLLLFYKENPLKAVPNDYQVVCNSKRMEYVLAIKKEKLNDYVKR